MNLELVSFAICPFVQRAVITLKEKKTLYQLTYIDLESPPVWFNEISPFGKVPLLKVDGEVLFESAIICEFLDESFPPALHPQEPLIRAKHRGWIEFGSNLLFEQVKVVLAKDEDEYQMQKEALGGSLARLSDNFNGGPYFSGERFALIDAAYAPLFMRFEILKGFRADLADIMPSNLAGWSEQLLLRQSVQESVVDDFKEQFVSFFGAKGSHILVQE
ncbi:MAG: glutathione S-transferase family protein [Sedimenticola sp.]|jgi:glutathione S-transferase|nr:MAG: glutathione S-transferase family protein [Sedimenticola sp.]